MTGSPLPAYFQSGRTDWETPAWLFERLDAEFRFTLDAAASADNAKCARFLGPGSNIAADALGAAWAEETVWLNPPYGRGLGAWMEKAARSRAAGATVVCLLPARTDTAWFHGQVLAQAQEVRFIRGRLKFGGSRSGAPFPSILAVYRPAPVLTSLSASPDAVPAAGTNHPQARTYGP